MSSVLGTLPSVTDRLPTLGAGRRAVSLVDWTSFLIMRAYGVRQAFTFDPNFAAEGFEVMPAGTELVPAGVPAR